MMMGGFFLVKKDQEKGVVVGKLSDWATFWTKDEVKEGG